MKNKKDGYIVRIVLKNIMIIAWISTRKNNLHWLYSVNGLAHDALNFVILVQIQIGLHENNMDQMGKLVSLHGCNPCVSDIVGSNPT